MEAINNKRNDVLDILQVLKARSNIVDVSNIIDGSERNLLKVRARMLQPPGFGLTVRTAAEGHLLEELQKDLYELLLTWKGITERAKSAALAADEGVEGAVPVMLHHAMGQTLSVVQDFFNEKVTIFVFVIVILFCQPGVIQLEHLTIIYVWRGSLLIF